MAESTIIRSTKLMERASMIMNRKQIDEKWMAMAISLARKGKGRTAPNPAVGAVIVKHGAVIGRGWHKKAGGPHAEAEALRSCKASPKGATIYVTLEPCNHSGKTPPCAPAIVSAGISEVVFGSKDRSGKPGPKGALFLKRAGVKVTGGVLAGQCDRLVEDFHWFCATGLPFLTLKTAVTLDGKIATRTGHSKWITSEKSRRMVHAMRNETDAVIVGADTVIYDDPSLTVRFGRVRRHPMRVIVDSAIRTPLSRGIFKTARDIQTIVATTRQAPAVRIKAVEKTGARVMIVKSRAGRVDLPSLFSELGKENIMSVMMESGGELASSAIKAGLVNRVMFFIAPKLAGGPNCALPLGGAGKMSDAWELRDVVISRCGPDIVVEGRLVAGKRK